MKNSTCLTAQELYDLLRTLEVISRLEEQSKAFNELNTVELQGFEAITDLKEVA